MPRPLLAMIPVVLIFGLVGGYSWFQANAPDQNAVRSFSAVTGDYFVELTFTFDAASDASFSLEDVPPSLEMKVNGKVVLRREDKIAAGEVIRVAVPEGLETGRNEVFVTAMPAQAPMESDGFSLKEPAAASPVSVAMRVRVLLDSQELTDQTIWSNPGGEITGSVRFDIDAPAEHAHE